MFGEQPLLLIKHEQVVIAQDHTQLCLLQQVSVLSVGAAFHVHLFSLCSHLSCTQAHLRVLPGVKG